MRARRRLLAKDLCLAAPVPERLRIRLVAEQAGHLPSFKGSLLRGALGWGLRRVACLTRRFDCPACALVNRCLYGELFESVASASGPTPKGLQRPPRPYVVEPPLDGRREYRAGSVLEWELVLLGPAIAAVPYILLALQQAAYRGLGPQRLRFQLQSVESVSGGAVLLPGRPDRWQLPRAALGDEEVCARWLLSPDGRVELEFRTPSRLVSEGRLVQVPTARAILEGLIRRVSLMARFYGTGNGHLPAQAWRALGQAVKVEDARTRWWALRRYSSRPQVRVSLGGFVGSVTLSGVAPELVPLLAWGAELRSLGWGGTDWAYRPRGHLKEARFRGIFSRGY